MKTISIDEETYLRLLGKKAELQSRLIRDGKVSNVSMCDVIRHLLANRG